MLLEVIIGGVFGGFGVVFFGGLFGGCIGCDFFIENFGLGFGGVGIVEGEGWEFGINLE